MTIQQFRGYFEKMRIRAIPASKDKDDKEDAKIAEKMIEWYLNKILKKGDKKWPLKKSSKSSLNLE